jgi:hypothetical protein
MSRSVVGGEELVDEPGGDGAGDGRAPEEPGLLDHERKRGALLFSVEDDTDTLESET